MLFVGTAAAQSPGEAFCNTDMDQTIRNIFTLIQFGGPLLGGLVALGATGRRKSRSSPVSLVERWSEGLDEIRVETRPDRLQCYRAWDEFGYRRFPVVSDTLPGHSW